MGNRSIASGALVITWCLASAALAQDATDPPEAAEAGETESPATEQGAEALSAPSDVGGGDRDEGASSPPDGAIPPPPSIPPPPPPDTAPSEPVPPPPTTPRAEGDTYAEPDPVLRLDGWLRRNEERAHTARISVAVLSLVIGAAAAGGAVWAYSQDDPDVRGVLGTLFVFDAVFQIGLGVAMLHSSFPQEDRYRRWRLARERGATALDVAAFAGEFRAEAEAQRFARRLGAIAGFALAAGGAAAVVLAAATEMTDASRIAAISFGSAFLVTGAVLGTVSLLVRSPVERDWERYERGLAPADEDAPALRLGATVLPGGGGLGLQGSF